MTEYTDSDADSHDTDDDEHQAQARSLRADGLSYPEIAEQIPNNPATGRPYHPVTVFQWVAAPDSEVHGA